ncbi:3-oxo-tetronate kinase [Streptomyces sp. NPDC008079]|uniref:3-oxo-tetronate kinase n=1 Tax=Streptomyces sp. NPDC008079 TaxID=3364806 RepID=UPI0036E83B8F
MGDSEVIGIIADDITGGSDVAAALSAAGRRTVQLVGVPGPDLELPPHDAVVVSLKTRSVPPEEAVAESLAALRRLRDLGARRIGFKICSTFDSTPRGNIGPVGLALADALDSGITLVCPAAPANGRTVYQGNLFVHDLPLAESSLARHPLNPMTDSNLVRLLTAQTTAEVGLVDHSRVRSGAPAVRARLADLRAAGVRFAVADAICRDDLLVLADAIGDAAFWIGANGLHAAAGAAAQDSATSHGTVPADAVGPGPGDFADTIAGPTFIVAGSCSDATRGQIAAFRESGPAIALDLARVRDDAGYAAEVVARALTLLSDSPAVLVHSAADARQPTEEAEAEAGAGTGAGSTDLGSAIETFLAELAAGAVDGGIRRLVVAGGETSGAVLQRLGVRALQLGGPIDPGVPWMRSLGPTELALALKSGNFGGPDFFLKAVAR